ncbi:MAG TPA: hypothetical protein VNA25_20335, partial [Phycisphaerae bacterium]|nr:hypothetical protein [Phycisphaerae bacterium]
MLNPGMRALRAVALCTAIAAASGTSAGAMKTAKPGGDVRIADFERQVPEGTHVGNVQANIVTDEGAAASGAGCLRLEQLDGREDAYLIFPLPADTKLTQRSKLVAWIRRTDTGKPIRMHWFALDGENWVIFQRLFHYEGGSTWVKMEWPLSQWRWGNERAGEWSDVRALALRVETKAAGLYLDDIHLTEDTLTDAFREEFLKKTAFGGRKSLLTIEDGLLVATDAVKQLNYADLKGMVAQMKQIRSWVKRTFGESARPISGAPPMALLVFAKRPDYLSFFKRLGTHWNVRIAPPRSGGYTVQDVAACVHERSGPEGQPVVLHETVHAVVCRELRLLPGAPAHAWLQEGLANYLQLCVYPESLEADLYAKHFSQPIGETTFFRPLKELLGKRVNCCHYAQLASLVAYLLEERPDWLGQIAAGLAAGKQLKAILRSLDTDIDELQRMWLEWGKRTYCQPNPRLEPAGISPCRRNGPSSPPHRRRSEGPGRYASQAGWTGSVPWRVEIPTLMAGPGLGGLGSKGQVVSLRRVPIA